MRLLALALTLSACTQAPERPLEAALEVPLANQAERLAFARLLVKTVGKNNLSLEYPGLDAVVRQSNEAASGIVIDAGNRVWVVSMQPTFGAAVFPRLRQRWPNSKTIPVNPDGSLPRMN